LSLRHWSALFGLVQTAEILVEKGKEVDLNAQTKSGETPLHLCAEKGKIDFVMFLIEKGAQIDITDKTNCAAYDAAKKRGHKNIMNLLKPPGQGGCCIIM